MLAPGVKLQVVSEVLGRSSIRMTADVYGHVLASDRRAAADAMDTVLWGPTSGARRTPERSSGRWGQVPSCEHMRDETLEVPSDHKAPAGRRA